MWVWEIREIELLNCILLIIIWWWGGKCGFLIFFVKWIDLCFGFYLCRLVWGLLFLIFCMLFIIVYCCLRFKVRWFYDFFCCDLFNWILLIWCEDWKIWFYFFGDLVWLIVWKLGCVVWNRKCFGGCIVLLVFCICVNCLSCELGRMWF